MPTTYQAGIPVGRGQVICWRCCQVRHVHFGEKNPLVDHHDDFTSQDTILIFILAGPVLTHDLPPRLRHPTRRDVTRHSCEDDQVLFHRDRCRAETAQNS